MSQKKDRKVLKILLSILGISLFGLGVYTYFIQRNLESDLSSMEVQKTQIRKKLKSLQAQYDQVSKEQKSLSKNLSTQKKRVEKLLDSLQKMNKNLEKLQRYRVEVEMLEAQNRQYTSLIDSLSQRNDQLNKNIDSAENRLTDKRQRMDSLNRANQNLSEKLLQSQQPKIADHHTSEQADGLKVCFLPVIEKVNETTTFYIQIINPDNNILGQSKSKRFQTKTLQYSKEIVVDPKSKEEVCEFVKWGTKKVKGTYWINIFYKEKQLISDEVKVN